MPAKKNSDLPDSYFRKNSRLNTQPSHSPVRTFGEVFSTGATIELIQGARTDGPLRLYLFDGKRATIAPQVQFNGRRFQPASFSRTIRRIVKLPSNCIQFGSTTRLFSAVQQVLNSHGYIEEVAAAAAYFVFATWFVEALPIAPCLIITGSRLEAFLLLSLLGCLVRRPLPLGEFTRHSLSSLPTELRPTLLIHADQIGPAALGLLRRSNHRNAFFPLKDGLADFFCAKAIFLGDVADFDILDESALRISLLPSRDRLPIVDEKYVRELTRKFQPQFLAYRCRYILDVQESKFDLPELTSGTRMLARVLGAPIVNAPGLQAGLSGLLREHEEDKQAFRWTDLRCVVIEALLHHCHRDPGARVHVGSVTKTVIDILKGRGDMTNREPREIGAHIRGVGLRPKRNGGGYAILFDSAVCRHVHRLAYAYDVAAMRKAKEGCVHCTSVITQR